MMANPSRLQILTYLADHLRDNRQVIMNLWIRKVKDDEKMGISSALGPHDFLDHIPKILSYLEYQIRMAEEKAEMPSRELQRTAMEKHGLVRWQQGYSISEVVRDWNHLRSSIIEILAEKVAEKPDWRGQGLSEAVRVITDLIAEGVNSSVSEYEEIRRKEARGHTIELQATINYLQCLLEKQKEIYKEARHDLTGNLGILASIARTIHVQSFDDGANDMHVALESGLSYSLQILEELKYHAQLEAGTEYLKLSTFHLSELIQRVSSAYHVLAKEDHLIFEVDGPESFEIQSDPLKITRILQNLLNNAFSFTQEGKVELRWGNLDDGRFWVLEIKNSGLINPISSSLPIQKKLMDASEASPPVDILSKDPETDHGGHSKAKVRDRSPKTGSHSVDGNRRDCGEGIGLSIVKRLCDILNGRLFVSHLDEFGGISVKIVMPKQFRKDFDDSEY